MMPTIDNYLHAFFQHPAGKAFVDFLVAYGPWLQVALLLATLPVLIVQRALFEEHELP